MDIMQITITSTRRATNDGSAWALQVHRGKRWTTERWYPSLSSLFNDLPERVLAGSNPRTLAEALTEVHRLGTELSRQIERLQRRLGTEVDQ